MVILKILTMKKHDYALTRQTKTAGTNHAAVLPGGLEKGHVSVPQDSSDEAMLVINAQGAIIESNPGACLRFG